MPSFDGFVRLSPSHCDHNCAIFERCDVCSLDDRRTFHVDQHGWHTDVTITVGDFVHTFDRLTTADLYDLTSRLVDAGWSQAT